MHSTYAAAPSGGIDLVGAALLDTSWQAAAGADFALSCFTIDWERHTVTCPGGKTSRPWTEAWRDAYRFYQVRFAKADCLACPLRAQCTRAAAKPRQLSVRPREEHVALQLARQRQATDAFVQRYKKRAAVAGTLARGVQNCGLRRVRYQGLAKVRLEHVAIAAGTRLQRLDSWWTKAPRVTTRTSRFVALAAA